LVTTLTKKMAEDLTDFLDDAGVRVRYLHSDVDTLRRVELLTELRAGVYDVLVGINLLREGLDLPEVSLVAILDADKEGFLRSQTSLIQTIGRAARNVSGEVYMYAQTMTDSMKFAIGETNRRREIQVAYNTEHGIDPTPLRKKIGDITAALVRESADTDELVGQAESETPVMRAVAGTEELPALIRQLTDQMMQASSELKFELAARLRDEVAELKRELREMTEHASR
jgi:excinuclease ABC subunit B